MPQTCPCQSTNPLAQTVYPLQGSKVHPNFQNKKNFFRKKILSASTTTRKIRWIHWWNPLTINGDICNFMITVSALSNRSQCSVYNYTRGRYFALGNTCPVQLFLVCLCVFSKSRFPELCCSCTKLFKCIFLNTAKVLWQSSEKFSF